MVIATLLGLSDQVARYDRSRFIVGVLFALFAVLFVIALTLMKRTGDMTKRKRLKAYGVTFAVLAGIAAVAFGIITFAYAPTESLPAY